MKNSKLCAIGLVALSLIGCEYDVSGVLVASEQLVFNYTTDAKDLAKRARKGKEVTKVLPAGRYQAKIEIEKSDVDIKANNIAVQFRIPKGIPLPKNGGQMFVPAHLSAQPYDLSADVEMDITQSAETRDFESCFETITYDDCSCGPDGQITCQTRTQQLRADMDVSYYFKYTTRDIQVDIIKAGTNQSVGQFTGSRTDSEKIYTYKGACLADPREVRNIRRTERRDVRDCRPLNQPPSEPGSGGPRGPRPDRPRRP
jgi:hypothetical protein